MSASKFRFKNYEFKYNPRKFSVSKERNLLKFTLPEQKTVFQDMGYEPSIITGEGELIGDNLMQQYAALQNLYAKKDSGILYIPYLSPINCYFSKLEITGKSGPKILTYAFEFIEEHSSKTSFSGDAVRYYIAVGGESLYKIANAYGYDVNYLITKNPHIVNITKIDKGVTVWL